MAAQESRAEVTLGDQVLAHLVELVRDLKALVEPVRADAPDAVHQMRVVTRRIRSVLASFGDCFETAATTDLRLRLQWLATSLGQARDAEVVAQLLDEHLAGLDPELLTGPVLRRIGAALSARHRAAHAQVCRDLASPSYKQLVKALDRFIATPPITAAAARPAQAAARRHLRAAIDRVARAAARAERLAGDDQVEALHTTRKRAKAARYAVAATRPGAAPAGAEGKAPERSMAAIQSVLGDQQDRVQAQLMVLRISQAAHESGEPTFSYGVLHERLAGHAGSPSGSLAEVNRTLEQSRTRWPY